MDADGDRHDLASDGEDAVVRQVVAAFGTPPSWVIVPPGDDAAVLDVAGLTVVSTDTLVQNEDFRLEWSDAVDVGVKVAAQNLADIAAMGAVPRALLVSLAAPDELPVGWATGLADGLALECARAGASVVGGDLSRAPVIVITGTAIGTCPGTAAPVRRSGATPGDIVAVTRGLGRSAAGLQLLTARIGTGDVPAEVPEHAAGASDDDGPGPGRPGAVVLGGLVRDHRRPRPPYDAGPAAAAAGATAMIDVSDGLVRDARRLAAASAVVIDLQSAALQPSPALRYAGVVLAQDAAEWVLSGGEDHALLACFPAGTRLPPAFRVIGVVRAAEATSRSGTDSGTGTGTDSGSDSGTDSVDEATCGDVLLDGNAYDGPDGWHNFGRPVTGSGSDVRGLPGR